MYLTKKHLLNLKYIIPIYPLLLLTGPFLPDLILTFAAIIYIIYLSKNKGWTNFLNKKYNKIFFILYFIMVISSLFSEYPLYSLKTSIFHIRFIFFLNAIIYVYNNDSNLFKNFCLVNFFTLIFVSFDTIFQFYMGYNIFGLSSGNSARIGSFFGKELIVGSFLSRLFPFFIIYLFFFNEKSINIFIKFAAIFFVGIAIYFSGERTSFAYFLISFFAIFLIIKNKKTIIFLVLVLFITLSYVALKNVKSYNRMILQTINQIYDNKSKKIFFFSKEHTVLAKISIKMFKNNKILGVGPKNFRNECFNNTEKYIFLEEYAPDHYCTTHPHNIFFQFLAETGVLGTLFYLVFFISIIRLFLIEIFRIQKNIISIFLLISLIISIFPFAPSGQFFNNWLSIFLFFFLSFLIKDSKNVTQHNLKNTDK